VVRMVQSEQAPRPALVCRKPPGFSLVVRLIRAAMADLDFGSQAME